jgi:patatin-like phospholipase/acyl hydrolase
MNKSLNQYLDVYNKDTGKTVNLNIDDVIEKLYYNTIKLLNPKDKIKISEYEGKIPLYDIYTSNLYLIFPENLFQRITYNHYRFPNDKLIKELEKEIDELEKDKLKDLITEIKVKKFKLMNTKKNTRCCYRIFKRPSGPKMR